MTSLAVLIGTFVRIVGTNVPRGEARREAILRATLALIGARGPDAVTHRAVAERAGVPLASTTYWFESKEDLLQETLLLAAREEVARLERLVLELAPSDVDVAGWARAVASVLAADVEADPVRHVAFVELVLEGTRRPWLREEIERWDRAHLSLAELGLRATGSPDPRGDAQLVVAAITGLLLGQIASPRPDFEGQVFRPALERLFTSLVAEPAPMG
jgi:TetR/AcrR family transcriptional regulator, regulator of biofilm formation and stress response